MNNLISDKINHLLKEKDKIIIAIDGKSTSGKTTLANELFENFDCNVFHIDDFYLPFNMRTVDRMEKIGGNIHFERLISEVVNSLKIDTSFKYGVFDCSEGTISRYRNVKPKKINIIEGVYCMHPCMQKIYDLKIFLEISEQEQLARLKKRNPEKLEQFLKQWIPRENKYFDSLDIENVYDLIISTDSV